MFIYENGNSLNLTFKGNIPVENPEIVIKGFVEGASLTVNGETFGIAEGTEYTEKSKTLVYQRDNKLMITFRGISGMSNPEVTIDDLGEDNYSVVVSGESVTLKIVDDSVQTVTDPVENTQETAANEVSSVDLPGTPEEEDNETDETVEE